MRANVPKIAMWTTAVLGVWWLSTAKDRLDVSLPFILLACLVLLHLLIMGRVPWRVLRQALPADRDAFDYLWDAMLSPWFFSGAVIMCGLVAFVRGGVVPNPGLTFRALDVLQIVTAVLVFVAHGYYTFLAFIISVPPDKLK